MGRRRLVSRPEDVHKAPTSAKGLQTPGAHLNTTKYTRKISVVFGLRVGVFSLLEHQSGQIGIEVVDANERVWEIARKERRHRRQITASTLSRSMQLEIQHVAGAGATRITLCGTHLESFVYFTSSSVPSWGRSFVFTIPTSGDTQMYPGPRLLPRNPSKFTSIFQAE